MASNQFGVARDPSGRPVLSTHTTSAPSPASTCAASGPAHSEPRLTTRSPRSSAAAPPRAAGAAPAGRGDNSPTPAQASPSTVADSTRPDVVAFADSAGDIGPRVGVGDDAGGVGIDAEPRRQQLAIGRSRQRRPRPTRRRRWPDGSLPRSCRGPSDGRAASPPARTSAPRPRAPNRSPTPAPWSSSRSTTPATVGDESRRHRRVRVGHGLAARFRPQAAAVDVDVRLGQRRRGLPRGLRRLRVVGCERSWVDRHDRSHRPARADPRGRTPTWCARRSSTRRPATRITGGRRRGPAGLRDRRHRARCRSS